MGQALPMGLRSRARSRRIALLSVGAQSIFATSSYQAPGLNVDTEVVARIDRTDVRLGRLRVELDEAASPPLYRHARIQILRVDLHSVEPDQWCRIPIPAMEIDLLQFGAQGA